MGADPRAGDVSFRKRGLIPIAAVALIAAAMGAAVIVSDVVGDRDPRPLVITVGAATVMLGAWLTYGAAERARSIDPAIAVRDDVLHLHVTPGRPVSLCREQISSIHGPEPSAYRPVAGRRQVTIATTLPSGLLSTKIVVAERLVDAPIDQVAALLRGWHRGDA